MDGKSTKYSSKSMSSPTTSTEARLPQSANQNEPVTTTVISMREDEPSLKSNDSCVFDESKATKVIERFGVRITPAVVRFNSTFENQSYTETVSVQNISDTSVTVRIYNPRAWSFRLTPLDRGHLLAPGLKVKRRIHYTSTRNGIVQSSLPIYINENIIDLPLEAFKGQAFVEISPTSVKFGRVDIGCKPVEKRIIIKNVSFCATKFLLDVGSNELDLHVSPTKGWIRPHSGITVVLQLLALREGRHSTELWITTDLCQTRVQVEVEASRRNLIALHPNTISDFTLVDFPGTFYGCRRYQTVVVYNMAASSTAFVVLADYGSAGQVPFSEAKNTTNMKMFNVEPLEGRIRPFEQRIFTFWFNPKITEGSDKSCWKSQKSKNIANKDDYLCTVRIKRIQVDDVGEESLNVNDPSNLLKNKAMGVFGNHQSNYNFDIESNENVEEGAESLTVLLLEEISLLFYLYGEAEVPSMSVTPDSLYFPNTLVGTTVVKVVQLTNNNNQTLAFRYSKIPFFNVLPEFRKLAPKSSYDVTVKLCTKNIGVLKRNIIFEILAVENATDKENFHVVGKVTVHIFGEVKSQKIVPDPKFNPGITPLITHEVGFLTDEVMFSSKIEKPRGAMTAVGKRCRPWHHTDATIAFPNDRPLTLRSRATDAKAKTIYKGLPRYVAPIDESMTYTIDNLMKKKAHDDIFMNYIRNTAALALSKDHCCKWKVQKPDTDPPVVLFEDRKPNVPRELFVPLTFVHLYRIRVYPALISFGSVTTSKSCSQLLNIENNNDFNISARILPLTSGLSTQTLENFIILKNSEAKISVTFHREILGRFSGTISCIINGYHSFDIAVVAEVVHRSLTITPDSVEIKVPDSPFTDMCVPVAINNPLNIPISFSWVIPEESPIKIEPIIGVAPKRGTIWCGVFFEPENSNYKLHPIKLSVEGSGSLKLKTAVILPKTNVYFLESVLNIGFIPMNLATERRFFIFNPDFSDAMFVVLNKDPIKGVKVKPASGTIRAKSCHSLSLEINVPTEKVLDFTIYMTLQNSATIEMKVTGNVVFPDIVVLPQYINFHRVPCNSFTRSTLIAENRSQAKATVGFSMDEYPQFKVSLSKRHHEPSLTNHGFTLEPGATQKFYLHFFPKDLAAYDFYLPIVINNLCTSRNSSNKEMEAQGRVIKDVFSRMISEGRRFSLSTPHRKTNLVMPHLVLVNVVVLKASLMVSDVEVFFSSTSETKKFSVKNISDQAIDVIIRSEDFQDLFDVQVEGEDKEKGRSSHKLTLPPEDSIDCIVTLTATSPGLHISDVSIVTAFEDYSGVYNTVRLTGNVPFPCVINPSVKEIYFHPVPLNMEVSFVFHLDITHNQQNKEIVISSEIINPYMDLFTVEYQKGNIISGVTKCTIPVKITFCSSFPVSLRKQVTFKGGKHCECPVTMIATADNCLLTTHVFLKTYFPYEPRLKVVEGTTENVNVLENERKILSKQQSQHQDIKPTKDSSSGSSSTSFMSLKTITSPSISCRTKSILEPQRLKTSVVKERQLISNSDIELSYELNEKVEKEKPPGKESLAIVKIITKEDDELTFPMFPLEPAVSEHASYMNNTLNTVQQWVYEQVFCCSYNPFFGSHSFSSFPVSNKKDYRTSSSVAQKNVFDALERICGRRVRRYFTPIDKLPEDPTLKAVFTYNLYRQLVEFMVTQGALMAHVEPKYLMAYDDFYLYIMSTTSVTDRSQEFSNTGKQVFNDELIDPDKFFSISVQCWLDLFLQMFKTLVLGPTVGISYHTSKEDSRRLVVQTHDYEAKKLSLGRGEEILMIWLTHQYNTQRTVVWPNKSPPPRTISNFNTDLEDGLVLTATTAAYCPYLTQIYFQGMSLNPTTISQAYHNALCLSMAWGSIKLGFSITARDIVHPNTVKMLLLVTHLYKILPSYKPEATITFSAILNASESQIVTLENDEEVSITYQVQILPQATNFVIQDCQNTFVLKRKSKGQITVQYMARNTNTAEAILLLCGACMPPKFGRNYVFKLEGNAVKLPVSSSFNIISPQNTPLDTHVIVESPHNLDFKSTDSYSYDLWISYTEPQPGNLNAECWAKERKRKIPQRLYFSSNTLVVTLNKSKVGSGVVNFKVCCFSQIVCYFWIIFRNPEIGDFIVKLQVTPRRPEPVLHLKVMVEHEESTLTHSQSTTVHVPCRNLEQWAAIRTMFELTTTPAEKEFWDTYIESNIGFRLLQSMLEEKKEKLNNELEVIFTKSKTYNITCASKYVTCTPNLHIADVRSNSSLPVELQLEEGTPSHMTTLIMTSEGGDEVRSYHLKIIITNEKFCKKLKQIQL